MKTHLLILALVSSIIQAETTPVKEVAKVPQATSKPQGNAFAVSLVKTSNNTSWVDQKIEEIKPQRNGLRSSSLSGLKSPFIVIRKEVKSDGVKAKVTVSKTDAKSLLPTRKDMSKEPLTLQIVLNSTVLINGKWLKENDSFRGYKIAQIQSNHVVLERKNKKIKLFIAQKNDNINISTK